ncbi:MAG: hypothetical protein IPN34_22375 [Planctomycetes bacterium]|nr:hypothetical protein [Planctomycetota bacterium]
MSSSPSPAPFSRRSFLASLGAAGAASLGAAGGLATSAPAAVGSRRRGMEPVILGSGRHRYEWVEGWAKLPEKLSFGNTHGTIATDSKDRVYVNTDTANAVMVFERDGSYVGSWGKDWAGGLHGMVLRKEADGEFLYLSHIGRSEFLKATTAGEVVWVKGWPQSSGLYKEQGQFRPTSIAVAPDGRIFVADGYGLSYVHRYDAKGEYLGSFGGRGGEPGKMQTPHGLWIDTRGGEPRLIVCDRENHRLQIFSLEGELLEVRKEELRRPCNAHERNGDLVVADLTGRITILDRWNLLVAHLGEQPEEGLRAQNGVPAEKWQPGIFLSPHGAHWDQHGDLYVMDWNFLGRVNKLRHVQG